MEDESGVTGCWWLIRDVKGAFFPQHVQGITIYFSERTKIQDPLESGSESTIRTMPERSNPILRGNMLNVNSSLKLTRALVGGFF